jgi:hypothetical protein
MLWPRAMGSSPRWAKLRAAVISYFVAFNVLAALPTLGTASAERLERPFEREELARWTRLFRTVGVEMDPERLSGIYLALASAVTESRAVVLWPIDWWFALTQTAQSWRLFNTPDQAASALSVSAFAPGYEDVLYESGDPARSWNSGLLEYRRIRAAYNPTRSGPPPTYPGLCRLISEQVFASMPEVERVRVALLRVRILVPGGEAHASGREEEHVLEFSRPLP